eukprot:SAG31_NODE_1228_length_9228_cov_5.337386_10_plen_49_part_00
MMMVLFIVLTFSRVCPYYETDSKFSGSTVPVYLLRTCRYVISCMSHLY